ncbi:vpr protein [Simian immunodeficiency virus]|uniref:Vpr protein n=1 Tax=Simian immunodeficiency virus TaxID=11723 RepID=Q6VG38_SIV|nr:vpr protein [Simian immunodeficiency virus]
MEQPPQSHPLHWTSRMVPIERQALQAAIWELNEEALKHFSREELRGIWEQVTELPADPAWNADQAWAACAIDYTRWVQTILYRHYREGCYHRYAEQIRRYPVLRPMRGTAPGPTSSVPQADPDNPRRPSRYRMDE